MSQHSEYQRMLNGPNEKTSIDGFQVMYKSKSVI